VKLNAERARYLRAEKGERDLEGGENTELKCLRGRHHDACAIPLSFGLSQPLLRSPNPFCSFTDAVAE